MEMTAPMVFIAISLVSSYFLVNRLPFSPETRKKIKIIPVLVGVGLSIVTIISMFKHSQNKGKIIDDDVLSEASNFSGASLLSDF